VGGGWVSELGARLGPQPLDLTRQFLPAPIDARLDRAFRQAETIGDLLVGVLLDVAQKNRCPQRRRQLRERLPEHRDQIVLLERGQRTDLARHRRDVVGGQVAVDGLALLPHAAVVVDAQVAADADEPRLEVGPSIEGVERPEDLQKDVLRQVLGFVVPADELVGDVEHLAPVEPDDRLPGELISTEAALDERVRRRSRGRLDQVS
jgi:hypothetical protein